MKRQSYTQKSNKEKRTEKRRRRRKKTVTTSYRVYAQNAFILLLWHPMTTTHGPLFCSLHIISNWILLSLERNTKKREHIFTTYTINTLSIKSTTVNCLIYFSFI